MPRSLVNVALRRDFETPFRLHSCEPLDSDVPPTSPRRTHLKRLIKVAESRRRNRRSGIMAAQVPTGIVQRLKGLFGGSGDEHTAHQSDSGQESTGATGADDGDKRAEKEGEAGDAELIWLFDNTASQAADGSGKWTAEYYAAYFATRTGEQLADAVGDVSKALGLGGSDNAGEKERVEKRIEERLTPFFDAALENKRCTIEVDDGNEKSRRVLGPSNDNGISDDVISLEGEHKDGDVVAAKVAEPATAKAVSCNTTFAEPEGWAVVSDIDDTIKKTLTNDSLGILQTTFVDEPEAISGMPEFYKWMDRKLYRPPFWYLSASPYNLYPFLHSFRDAHYPAGTMLLRRSSWQNLMSFIASLTKGTQQYKVDQLRQVHRNFPNRKFVCLGDSTQTDPESYAQLYKDNPDWIKAVFIRKVADVKEITDAIGGGQEERNKPERFEKAFEGVPKNVWHVFDDPKELYEKVEALVGS